MYNEQRNPEITERFLCHYIGLVLRAGHAQSMIVQYIHGPFLGLNILYSDNGFVLNGQGHRPKADLHAFPFIRNVVPLCTVSILHFCTVVSYFYR